jgi:TldD protein
LKKIKGLLLVPLLSVGLLFTPYNTHSAEAKVYWDGVELKPGQIGRLTVLKQTPLYKLVGNKKVFVRNLKPGQKFRVFTLKSGMLGVGGEYYVNRDSRVKYEVPSKTKLNQVKMEQLFRGAKMGMSASQIKKLETAKFLGQTNNNGINILIYSTSIFGYNTQLLYGFHSGKLVYFGYTFDPEQTYTRDQLTKIYNNLKQQLISLFGNNYEQSDSGKGYPSALTFKKDKFTITLSYDDDGLWIDIE